MSKHIDYLMQFGNNEDGTPFPISASFEVDTSQLYVEAVYDPGHDIDAHFLKDGDEKSGLESYDNFELLALGFALPSGFDIYSPNALINIAYRDSEASLVYLTGLGNTGRFLTPFANFEIPVGIMFSPVTLDMAAPRRFGMKITEVDGDPLKISMIGVSSRLDGETFEVSGFMKILHNTVLT